MRKIPREVPPCQTAEGCRCTCCNMLVPWREEEWLRFIADKPGLLKNMGARAINIAEPNGDRLVVVILRELAEGYGDYLGYGQAVELQNSLPIRGWEIINKQE